MFSKISWSPAFTGTVLAADLGGRVISSWMLPFTYCFTRFMSDVSRYRRLLSVSWIWTWLYLG
jgi:hypothetical protein